MKCNMKKTYINPEVEVVELQMQQAMLAGSDDVLNLNGETNSLDDLLQREFGDGLWD